MTDFLPAERARGITIQSAAITFQWPPTSTHAADSGSAPRSSFSHSINLIDTPGHADFTFEVLRSLRVLDGAVCILDGVAGVEAQTEKVWTQASSYSIPRIIFVNKLDRDGAAFGQTVREIGARLAVWPAVCGIPWWSANGTLVGVGDVIGLRGLRYTPGGDGKDIRMFDLQQLESEDASLAAELMKSRTALVELLSEYDEDIVEQYLEADEDHLAILSAHLTESLRRCVNRVSQTIVPVFAGASFRNIGVQPLLDAVVDLLPSPTERPDPEVSINDGAVHGRLAEFLSGKLSFTGATTKQAATGVSKNKKPLALQKLKACALAFKVVADARKGVLVYVRVYSGTMERNEPLWNTALQATERAQRLLKMYGNDAVDVESLSAGEIGVIPGLKLARTGDTLISYTGTNPKVGPPAPMSNLQLRPIAVPPPVFFVSVEPDSLAEEKHIKESLDLLLREDPSLNVSVDEESGQTHLSGMGELHLEIARDRLVTDLKAKARIGAIEISYRETITASADASEVVERILGGKSSNAGCDVIVYPLDSDGGHLFSHCHHIIELPDGNVLGVSTPTLHADGSTIFPDAPGLNDALPLQKVIQAFRNGVSAALARGPKYGYPLHSTAVKLAFNPSTHLYPNTTAATLSSVARKAVQRALHQSSQASDTALMEPLMLATVSVDEANIGNVVHDISAARGGTIVSLSSPTDDSASIDNPSPIPVSRIYAPRDPFEAATTSDSGLSNVPGTAARQIVARVPLKEMVGYLKHLRSLTAGRGTFTMVVDRFERMNPRRQKAITAEMRGGH